VSQAGGFCSRWLALIVVFILSAVILPAAAGPASHGSQDRMSRAVDKTMREGVHGKLPPHISTLLRLAQEQECPVMQRVVRTGTIVQGFDVSTTNQNDIVLFVVDETTNDQTLYLTSAEGGLRRVVSVEAGVGAESRITDARRKAFEKEKRFWLDRLVPAGGSRSEKSK